MAKKTDREKLNKLVKKRTKTEERLKKLEGKKRAPLKKLRTKIQEKKKKRIQKKINANPTAQQDRKNALKKKLEKTRKKVMYKKTTPKTETKKKTLREKMEEYDKKNPNVNKPKSGDPRRRKKLSDDVLKMETKGKRKTKEKIKRRKKTKNPALRNPDGSIYRESEGRKSKKRMRRAQPRRRDLSSPLSPSTFDPRKL